MNIFNISLPQLLNITALDYIYKLFNMLGGIALFMYGMKLMSDNLERLAGKKMQQMMGRVSNNNLAGVGIGFGVTAIIQSSTAVTVMLVGFVNIGIISLMQATAIIIGSNIGTTLTMFLVSLKEFLNMTSIAALIAFAGFILIIGSSKDNLKRIGGILLGFGMIFVGLDFMSEASMIFEEPLKGFFATFQNSPILLVLFGTMFTAIVQSSSASTVMMGTFVAMGVVSFESAMYAIMGMNIGTCFTAMFSSVGTSVNAKRAAWIHLLVNVIPTVVAYVLMLLFKNQIIQFLETVSFTSAAQGGADFLKIANFHFFFNVFSALLLFPFIRPLGKIATLIVPGKEKASDGFMLKHLDERVLKTPAIAVSQAVKEVARMAALAKENLDVSVAALIGRDVSRAEEVKVREEEINFLNKAITRYLVQISNLEISFNDEKIIGSLFNVVTDIERVGDHADNIMRYSQKMLESNIEFSEEADADLKKVIIVLNQLYESTMLVFCKRQIRYIDDVNAYEEQVDAFKRDMTNSHIARLNRGECSAESGAIYLSLASNLERVADHFTNIAESVLTYTKPATVTAVKHP